jgi:hypothetical protein
MAVRGNNVKMYLYEQHEYLKQIFLFACMKTEMIAFFYFSTFLHSTSIWDFNGFDQIMINFVSMIYVCLTYLSHYSLYVL